MSDELRPCPFCGSEPHVEDYYGINRCYCPTSGCPQNISGCSLNEWQKRPLEDALQAKLDDSISVVEVGKSIGNLMMKIDALEAKLDDWESEQLELVTERDAMQAKLDEYEGENKRWHSFETVQAIVKERDALQAKLDIAVEALRLICGEAIQSGYSEETARKALVKLEGD